MRFTYSCARLLSFCVAIFGLYAHAFIPSAEKPVRLIDGLAERVSYIVPNELYPADALPAWKGGPRGVYVSVGTIRGFIGALESGASHLLLIDHDTPVVTFNRIMILMLKASDGDPVRFRSLMLRRGVQREWLKLAPWTDEERAWFNEISQTKWWTHTLQEISYSDFWHAHAPKSGKPFSGVHFLFDRAKFLRLYDMAINNRIAAAKVRLEAPDKLAGLADELGRAGLKISFVDLSNAWEVQYVGPARTVGAIGALRPALTSDSIVLVTKGTLQVRRWNYHVNSIGELDRKEFFQSTARLDPHKLPIGDAMGNRKLVQGRFLEMLQSPEEFAQRKCGEGLLGTLSRWLHLPPKGVN